jgi:hypothetical protein
LPDPLPELLQAFARRPVQPLSAREFTVSDGQGGTATTTVTVKVGTDKKETINGTSGADMIFGKIWSAEATATTR